MNDIVEILETDVTSQQLNEAENKRKSDGISEDNVNSLLRKVDDDDDSVAAAALDNDDNDDVAVNGQTSLSFKFTPKRTALNINIDESGESSQSSASFLSSISHRNQVKLFVNQTVPELPNNLRSAPSRPPLPRSYSQIFIPRNNRKRIHIIDIETNSLKPSLVDRRTDICQLAHCEGEQIFSSSSSSIKRINNELIRSKDKCLTESFEASQTFAANRCREERRIIRQQTTQQYSPRIRIIRPKSIRTFRSLSSQEKKKEEKKEEEEEEKIVVREGSELSDESLNSDPSLTMKKNIIKIDLEEEKEKNFVEETNLIYEKERREVEEEKEETNKFVSNLLNGHSSDYDNGENEGRDDVVKKLISNLTMIEEEKSEEINTLAIEKKDEGDDNNDCCLDSKEIEHIKNRLHTLNSKKLLSQAIRDVYPSESNEYSHSSNRVSGSDIQFSCLVMENLDTHHSTDVETEDDEMKRIDNMEEEASKEISQLISNILPHISQVVEDNQHSNHIHSNYEQLHHFHEQQQQQQREKQIDEKMDTFLNEKYVINEHEQEQIETTWKYEEEINDYQQQKHQQNEMKKKKNIVNLTLDDETEDFQIISSMKVKDADCYNNYQSHDDDDDDDDDSDGGKERVIGIEEGNLNEFGRELEKVDETNVVENSEKVVKTELKGLMDVFDDYRPVIFSYISDMQNDIIVQGENMNSDKNYEEINDSEILEEEFHMKEEEEEMFEEKSEEFINEEMMKNELLSNSAVNDHYPFHNTTNRITTITTTNNTTTNGNNKKMIDNVERLEEKEDDIQMIINNSHISNNSQQQQQKLSENIGSEKEEEEEEKCLEESNEKRRHHHRQMEHKRFAHQRKKKRGREEKETKEQTPIRMLTNENMEMVDASVILHSNDNEAMNNMTNFIGNCEEWKESTEKENDIHITSGLDIANLDDIGQLKKPVDLEMTKNEINQVLNEQIIELKRTTEIVGDDHLRKKKNNRTQMIDHHHLSVPPTLVYGHLSDEENKRKNRKKCLSDNQSIQSHDKMSVRSSLTAYKSSLLMEDYGSDQLGMKMNFCESQELFTNIPEQESKKEKNKKLANSETSSNNRINEWLENSFQYQSSYPQKNDIKRFGDVDRLRVNPNQNLTNSLMNRTNIATKSMISQNYADEKKEKYQDSFDHIKSHHLLVTSTFSKLSGSNIDEIECDEKKKKKQKDLTNLLNISSKSSTALFLTDDQYEQIEWMKELQQQQQQQQQHHNMDTPSSLLKGKKTKRFQFRKRKRAQSTQSGEHNKRMEFETQSECCYKDETDSEKLLFDENLLNIMEDVNGKRHRSLSIGGIKRFISTKKKQLKQRLKSTSSIGTNSSLLGETTSKKDLLLKHHETNVEYEKLKLDTSLQMKKPERLRDRLKNLNDQEQSHQSAFEDKSELIDGISDVSTASNGIEEKGKLTHSGKRDHHRHKHKHHHHHHHHHQQQQQQQEQQQQQQQEQHQELKKKELNETTNKKQQLNLDVNQKIGCIKFQPTIDSFTPVTTTQMNAADLSSTFNLSTSKYSTSVIRQRFGTREQEEKKKSPNIPSKQINKLLSTTSPNSSMMVEKDVDDKSSKNELDLTQLSSPLNEVEKNFEVERSTDHPSTEIINENILPFNSFTSPSSHISTTTTTTTTITSNILQSPQSLSPTTTTTTTTKTITGISLENNEIPLIQVENQIDKQKDNHKIIRSIIDQPVLTISSMTSSSTNISTVGITTTPNIKIRSVTPNYSTPRSLSQDRHIRQYESTHIVERRERRPIISWTEDSSSKLWRPSGSRLMNDLTQSPHHLNSYDDHLSITCHDSHLSPSQTSTQTFGRKCENECFEHCSSQCTEIRQVRITELPVDPQSIQPLTFQFDDSFIQKERSSSPSTTSIPKIMRSTANVMKNDKVLSHQLHSSPNDINYDTTINNNNNNNSQLTSSYDFVRTSSPSTIPPTWKGNLKSEEKKEKKSTNRSMETLLNDPFPIILAAIFFLFLAYIINQFLLIFSRPKFPPLSPLPTPTPPPPPPPPCPSPLTENRMSYERIQFFISFFLLNFHTKFAELSGIRIIRIATNPKYQKMGYGSEAIKQLSKYFNGAFAKMFETNPVAESSLRKDTKVDIFDEENHSNGNEDLESDNLMAIDDNNSSEIDQRFDDVKSNKFIVESEFSLLRKLEELEPPYVNWIGVSYSLSEAVYKFWRSLHFLPVYLRQQKNHLTGEHTCIMLMEMNTNENNQSWLSQYYFDFRRRFFSLLSYDFRLFPSKMALSFFHQKSYEMENWRDRARILDGSELFDNMTQFDLQRLEKFCKNLVDSHLITDLVPVIGRWYFNGKLKNKNTSLKLSMSEELLLLAVAAQHKSLEESEKEFELSRNQINNLFMRCLRKIVQFLIQLNEEMINKKLNNVEKTRPSTARLIEETTKINPNELQSEHGQEDVEDKEDKQSSGKKRPRKEDDI
ncbi:hypothetical protein SNEBB_009667 [Seison nebaliae]|nr:hypothetical protein SNEBB_009667 [Seison nebaliae]